MRTEYIIGLCDLSYYSLITKDFQMQITMKRSVSYLILFFIGIFNLPVFSQPVGYHSNTELGNYLEQLSDDFSNIIKLESHGKTLGGGDLWSLTLGSGETSTKPAVLMVAGVNGTDLAGTELLLAFAKSTANNYDKLDSIKKMLDQTTFYIFPRVNPDATESLFNNPVYSRSLNSRAMDLDNDGKADEDGYDDLNKDGQITWMRITEPGGEYLIDEDYPALLKKADATKGELGIYRLIREGLDNDKDGQFNEDEPGGVNFNQNFTFKYNYFIPGAGFHQISEVETRAVSDFAFSHSNIVAVFTFGPNDNLSHPWEAAKGAQPERSKSGARIPVEQVDQKDVPFYAHVSQKFKEITELTDLPKTAGGAGAFNEWGYFHFGRWSFSTPAWWPQIIESKSDTTAKSDSSSLKSISEEQKPGKPKQQENKSAHQKLWDWLQQTNQENAFVEWKEFKHPDFPDKKVEIGGFKALQAENPPPDSLAGISDKYNLFFYQLAGWLPRVDVQNLKVEHLHDNVYRISLVVINQGYLPTNTNLGTRNKWSPKIKVAVELSKNQELAGGKVLQFLDILNGSGGSKEYSWMVVGRKDDSVKLSIGSPMTGVIIKTFKLQ
jgi:hypothetical protein